MSPTPKLDPAEVDHWPLAESGLPRRLIHSASRRGLRRVGELRALTEGSRLRLRHVGEKTTEQVRAYFRLCRQLEEGRLRFRAMDELLHYFLDPTEYEVLAARFGFRSERLDSTPEGTTLQAVGRKLKVTRQRVLQIQGEAMENLASRPAVVLWQPLIAEFKRELARRGHLVPGAALHSLQGKPPAGKLHPAAALRCLGELFPGIFACFRDLFSILPEPTLRAAETELVAVLNAAAQPLGLEPLLARTAAFCNEGAAFPRAEVVARLLERCPAVATTRDRRYFTYERGAARWLADVLREAGRPLRYGPLARAFNAGLQPACHRGRGFLVELVRRQPGFQTDARGVALGTA